MNTCVLFFLLSAESRLAGLAFFFGGPHFFPAPKAPLPMPWTQALEL